MSKTFSNLLIVCYGFPPNPGIGGRRWAKFAKYLSRKGYEIYVINAQQKNKELSEWSNDIKSENIHIESVKAFYPSALTHYSDSLCHKIGFRFWTLFFQLFSKGVIYERTFFWKKPFLKLVTEIIIKKNIQYVIVTIPPFRLAYYALQLKTANKNLKLIVDYRDPWTDNKTFHGFKNLSSKRLNYEKKNEQEVLQQADFVISTTEQMTNWAKEKLTNNKEKCLTIPNGFDNEDILLEKKSERGKKIFLCAGSLYNDLEYLLIPFIRYIKNQEAKDYNFSDKYGFEFYGKANDMCLSLLNNCGLKSILYKGFISRQELNEKYNNSNFFMMFSVADHAFAFNTKFYEYLAYKKPIIHFSNDGAVNDFLESNRLGMGVRPESFDQDMDRLFKLIDVGFEYNNDFDVSQFSIDKLTEKLEQLFK